MLVNLNRSVAKSFEELIEIHHRTHLHMDEYSYMFVFVLCFDSEKRYGVAHQKSHVHLLEPTRI